MIDRLKTLVREAIQEFPDLLYEVKEAVIDVEDDERVKVIYINLYADCERGDQQLDAAASVMKHIRRDYHGVIVKKINYEKAKELHRKHRILYG